MNTLSFDSKRCERIRQQLDSYLSNELLVETASEVLHHLESCQACSRDFESRIRVRDALQRAVSNRPVPDSVRTHVVRKLRASQTRSFAGVSVKRWALGLATAALVLFCSIRAGMVETAPWRTVNRKHSEAWRKRPCHLRHSRSQLSRGRQSAGSDPRKTWRSICPSAAGCAAAASRF